MSTLIPTLIPQLPPRLCGCSFMFGNQSLAQGLDLARSFGFDHIDIGIGGGNGHFNPVEVALNPDYYAAQVLQEIERRGIYPNECFVLNFGTDINTPDLEVRRQNREYFKGFCQFAGKVGFKSIMFLAGPVHPELGRQRSIDLAVEAYQELIPISNYENLQLNIEPDCDSCVNTPEDAAELCRRVPGLGLTLDYSHFICQGIEQREVEKLHPYTQHIHIRQAAPQQIVTDVDSGTIDFNRVMEGLTKVEYDGLFCIEYLAITSDQQARRAAEERTIAMCHDMHRFFN